jgi:hypothetical protein
MVARNPRARKHRAAGKAHANAIVIASYYWIPRHRGV